MRITFLVGNGFDLGIGLKTSYNDFLQHYCNVGEKSDGSSAAEDNLKQRIEKDQQDAWGDAEVAFAKLPLSEIVTVQSGKEEEIEKLITSFTDSMTEYLKNEESRMAHIVVRGLNCGGHLNHRMIASIDSGLLAVSSTKKSSTIIGRVDNLEINAINFNYTSAFDYFYSEGRFGDEWEEILAYNGHSVTARINPPIHIHGTLSDKNALFGVSSSKQISDDRTRALSETTGLLVKERLDLYGQEGKYDLVTQILEESEVIVTFGVSFGASDKYWWNLLCRLVVENPNLKIVIMPYSSAPKQLNRFGEIRIHNHIWRRKFISSIWDEKTDEEKDKISRVLNRVKVNSYGPYSLDEKGFVLSDPWGLGAIKQEVLACERGA